MDGYVVVHVFPILKSACLLAWRSTISCLLWSSHLYAIAATLSVSVRVLSLWYYFSLACNLLYSVLRSSKSDTLDLFLFHLLVLCVRLSLSVTNRAKWLYVLKTVIENRWYDFELFHRNAVVYTPYLNLAGWLKRTVQCIYVILWAREGESKKKT